MINHYIEQSFRNTNDTLQRMLKDQALARGIEQSIQAVLECFKHKNKVLFAGNGGSAADAQHMSAEYVSRFMFDRPGLPSIALTTDTSALTAIGNDYGFTQLFSRQIQALGQKGDLFFAYSTSGTSPNIIEALKAAKKHHMITIGLTGIKKGSEQMVELCDIALKVPSDSTPNIQEGHLMLGHIICGCVEEMIFGVNASSEYRQTGTDA